MEIGDETMNGYFPITEPLIEGPATRIMSLRDGTKKMSKSDPSDLSRINLTDTPTTSPRRSARPRPIRSPAGRYGRPRRPAGSGKPGQHLRRAGRNDKDAVLKDFGGQQFSVFKPALADLAVEKLSPIADEMRRLMADPGHIDIRSGAGAERASISRKRP
jgi:tryptophanyl-tRNA synthetase